MIKNKKNIFILLFIISVILGIYLFSKGIYIYDEFGGVCMSSGKSEYSEEYLDLATALSRSYETSDCLGNLEYITQSGYYKTAGILFIIIPFIVSGILFLKKKITSKKGINKNKS